MMTITDPGWYECGLPPFLRQAIGDMLACRETPKWECRRDLHFGEIQSCVNTAEVEEMITADQARYLRQKYLGYVYGDDGDPL